MRRKKQEAVRNEEIVQHDIFEACQIYYKDAIADAYDETYFEALRDDLLGFTHLTVSDMFDHLREQCLAMTSKEKKQKLKDINLEWEPNTDIRVFLSSVQKLTEQLRDEYDLERANDMRQTHVVSEFQDSEIFIEEEMMNWEEKPEAEKTYAAMVTYFIRAYYKHARYGSAKSTTSQGFESANNVTDQAKEDLIQLMLQVLSNQKEVTEAATADKEHVQTMSDSNGELLGIIKKLNVKNEKLTEQNLKLTKQVTTLTDALTKAKSSRGGGGGGGRGSRSGGDGDTSAGTGSNNSKRLKCGICGKNGHESKNCWELDKNSESRPDKWKSPFDE